MHENTRQGRALPAFQANLSNKDAVEIAVAAALPVITPSGQYPWSYIEKSLSAIKNAFARGALQAAELAASKPIPMILHCPACGLQHIDGPEEADCDGEVVHSQGWSDPPHRSHLCHNPDCKTIWRPADVPTRGVAAIETQGKADTWRPGAAAAAAAGPLEDEASVERAVHEAIERFGTHRFARALTYASELHDGLEKRSHWREHAEPLVRVFALGAYNCPPPGPGRERLREMVSDLMDSIQRNIDSARPESTTMNDTHECANTLDDDGKTITR